MIVAVGFCLHLRRLLVLKELANEYVVADFLVKGYVINLDS